MVNAHIHLRADADGNEVHLTREVPVTADTTVGAVYAEIEALAGALSWVVNEAWAELPVPTRAVEQ